MKGCSDRRRALSLFSGTGGMDIGVDDAGYDTVCAIESDVNCAATLRRNSRRKTVWQVDVRAVSPDRIREIFRIRPGGITLLYGSPPRQSAGRTERCSGRQGNCDLLVREFVRFARVLRPTAILVEQLPAFLRSSSPGGQPLIESLDRAFARLGYDVHARVLNAASHGVAQSRRRAIVVCVPAGQRFCFPSRAVSAPSVGEVLSGLPRPVSRGEVPLAPNHVDVTPPRDRERISFVPEGGWLARAPNVPSSVLMNLTKKDTTKFRRLDRNLTSLTLAGVESSFTRSKTATSLPGRLLASRDFPTSMSSSVRFEVVQGRSAISTSTVRSPVQSLRRWRPRSPAASRNRSASASLGVAYGSHPAIRSRGLALLRSGRSPRGCASHLVRRGIADPACGVCRMRACRRADFGR